MVAARLLAEATVLFILLFLPLVLWLLGRLAALPRLIQVLFFALSGVALIALPLYGFLTFAVRVDDRGLTSVSFFRRRFAEWWQMKALRFRASGFWRRYVLTSEGGEIAFPAWLNQQQELVELIRSKLPHQGGGESRLRIYRQDTVGLAYQLLRIALGATFILVFWCFYAQVGTAGSTSTADRALLLVVCVLATVLVGWRCLAIASMPQWVQLTRSELVIGSGFAVRRLPWEQVKKLAPTFFLLPEGYILRTGRGSFLLSDSLDGADELIEAIREQLAGKSPGSA